MQKLTEAVHSCQQTLELDKSDGAAWSTLGVAFEKQGSKAQLEEALVCHSNAVALGPDEGMRWYNRGITLDRLGRHSESVADFSRAVAVDPAHTLAWNNRGNALRRAPGRRGEAMASYDSAIAVKPSHSGAITNRATLLSELERTEEAISGFSLAIAASGSDRAQQSERASALLGRGGAYLIMERIAEAEESYRHAAGLLPQSAAALNNHCNTLHRLGRVAEAEAVCRLALAADAQHGWAWYNLGVTLAAAGGEVSGGVDRRAEAAWSYRGCLALQPRWSAAWEGLAAVQRSAGRVAEAEDSARRAVGAASDLAVNKDLAQASRPLTSTSPPPANAETERLSPQPDPAKAVSARPDSSRHAAEVQSNDKYGQTKTLPRVVAGAELQQLLQVKRETGAAGPDLTRQPQWGGTHTGPAASFVGAQQQSIDGLLVSGEVARQAARRPTVALSAASLPNLAARVAAENRGAFNG